MGSPAVSIDGRVAQPRAAQPGTTFLGTTSFFSRPLAHYLAAAGVVCLIWAGWTLLAWAADGPAAITAYRDASSYTWWAARAYEAAAVVLAIVMTVWLVRRKRAGQRIGFDVKFLIAGALGFWTDPMDNFIQPIWLYNSNWVNVGTWAGHMPFVLNPAAGTLPEPILFGPLVYSFGLLAFAVGVEKLARAIMRRRPDLSTAGVWLRLIVVGGVIDLALETPLLAMQLERMAGFPSWLSIGGHSPMKFAAMELLGCAVIFSGFGLLRMSRDDRGDTVVERGCGPGVRGQLVSILAVIGLVQLSLIGVNAGLAAEGLYSDHYPSNPPYLLNGTCGPTTQYGPCPGTTGYRAPLNSTPRQEGP